MKGMLARLGAKENRFRLIVWGICELFAFFSAGMAFARIGISDGLMGIGVGLLLLLPFLLEGIFSVRMETGWFLFTEFYLLAAMAGRIYPFPFRTRKSSAPAPMILPIGGKVGRRRLFLFSFCAPPLEGLFFAPGASLPGPARCSVFPLLCRAGAHAEAVRSSPRSCLLLSSFAFILSAFFSPKILTSSLSSCII